MNNRGQTLVMFIMLLPFLCMIMGYVVEKCYLLYQEKSLKSTASIVCRYALDTHKDLESLQQLALENDRNIQEFQVAFSDDLKEAEVLLMKEQMGIFSGWIRKKPYEIEVKVSCIE